MLNAPDHGEVAGIELSLGHADHDFARTRRLRVGQGFQLEDFGRLVELEATMAFMISLRVEMVRSERRRVPSVSRSRGWSKPQVAGPVP
jgi:hypothetical protein